MTHTIAITAKGCNPDLIEVMRGDCIVWRNDDDVIHRIVYVMGGENCTGDIEPGQASAEIPLPNRTLFRYRCKYHPSTHGAVIVVEG